MRLLDARRGGQEDTPTRCHSDTLQGKYSGKLVHAVEEAVPGQGVAVRETRCLGAARGVGV